MVTLNVKTGFRELIKITENPIPNQKPKPILNKIVNGIDWIIKYCGGTFKEIFYELRTEMEIQKLGYLLDF